MRAWTATIVGLVGFVLYLGAVQALAGIAGIAWVWPARRLLRWGAGVR